ncbi:MAG: hypothetical protein L3J36_14085 [Rhodobacteraceae bacterium]|nr:hypothetical protein [Paracoccaceae bacterium]
MILSADLEQAGRKLTEAGALLRAANDAHIEASNAFQTAINRAVKDGLNTLQPDAFPATDHRRHRRHHRPGRPAKIDTDPELQAYIAARIDRMTFVQIAEDIAQHFPPERHVRKTAIHAWWHRNKTRK